MSKTAHTPPSKRTRKRGNSGLKPKAAKKTRALPTGEYIPKTELGRRILKEAIEAEAKGEHRMSLDEIADYMRRIRE